MYENLMEEIVNRDNATAAWLAVKRNRGAAGIDRMTVEELRDHIRAHWESLSAKLVAGTYVPSPVRRVEIPKPNGGKRMLGIPTVLDRWIQQMLLQELQPIFDPTFSEHSYGFRPGRGGRKTPCQRRKRTSGAVKSGWWTWTSANSLTGSTTTF
jgi:retron-type reverse transcriptase